MNIQESMNAVYDISKHQEIIQDYVNKKYKEFFPLDTSVLPSNYGWLRAHFIHRKNSGFSEEYLKESIDEEFKELTWNKYGNFVLESRTKIRINYTYGFYESEYDKNSILDGGVCSNSSYIIVDILPEIREQKINSLLQ